MLMFRDRFFPQSWKKALIGITATSSCWKPPTKAPLRLMMPMTRNGRVRMRTSWPMGSTCGKSTSATFDPSTTRRSPSATSPTLNERPEAMSIALVRKKSAVPPAIWMLGRVS